MTKLPEQKQNLNNLQQDQINITTTVAELNYGTSYNTNSADHFNLPNTIIFKITLKLSHLCTEKVTYPGLVKCLQ